VLRKTKETNVGECTVQSRDWCVPEIVSVGDGLNEAEWSVAGSDDGYGTGCEVGGIGGREVAG